MKTSFLKAGALVMGVLLVLFTIAFKAEKRVQRWTFNGDSQSEVLQASQYTLNGTPAEDCGNTGDLPCEITVPDNITTQAQLDSYMAGKSVNDILAIASSKRSE
ncbi:hypothetical protein BDE36_2535 [Arcticibacter tournemirensis]|uniref:Uncharacterized protein n=1 Tax=Arcticibacter tournemirensis TaxID=699437 RepID=A0A5M9GS99_9SPHI|nr:hypothetical protein [Arcticibacter tournemirensis]KAA8475684.1 hypothetical protein F1649_21320 [Arcticibacter tournemirensis]TQM50773.1 hypothetical protein BDE36_2535 [Arcticibacter tournemirensis]